jgi:hypothetical protein
MNEWFLLRGDYGMGPSDLQVLTLGAMLAFLLGQTMAWVYMITHSGLSYSRSFVSSLVVTPMVVTVVMNVLTNNIITAFGLMAVFAIVRFRNILRDTLDTSYVLISIVVGMACGTQKFSTAVIGVVMVACILLYLWYTSFGSRHRYDLILNLQWSRPVEELEELRGLLDRHSRRIQLASQRTHEGYQAVDVSYRLLMRDSARAGELVTELQELPGVAHITTMEAEDESEL